jgi:hypothetical protein
MKQLQEYGKHLYETVVSRTRIYVVCRTHIHETVTSMEDTYETDHINEAALPALRET